METQGGYSGGGGGGGGGDGGGEEAGKSGGGRRGRVQRSRAPFARCSGTTTLRHIDFTGSLALTLGRPVH